MPVISCSAVSATYYLCQFKLWDVEARIRPSFLFCFSSIVEQLDCFLAHFASDKNQKWSGLVSAHPVVRTLRMELSGLQGLLLAKKPALGPPAVIYRMVFGGGVTITLWKIWNDSKQPFFFLESEANLTCIFSQRICVVFLRNNRHSTRTFVFLIVNLSTNINQMFS